MITSLQTVGAFAQFVSRVTVESVRRPPPLGASIQAAYTIGWKSLPILLIVSGFVGTNLAVQGYNAFAPLGGQRLVGMFVALAGVRELAPILVAAMVAAKAGTEMASQIAVMRIQEQIDAIEVMALSPHWILVTPRILGILLALPSLTMICILNLIVASYLVSVFQLGLNGPEFLALFAATTRSIDLVFCGVKAFVFGLVICLVSCFYGFNAGSGPEGVGTATNASVVVSAVACAVLNYLLSELMFG